jgi:Sulfotransferase family
MFGAVERSTSEERIARPPGSGGSAPSPDRAIATDVGTVTSAPSRRAPDFFIVGHQKCGTTALYMMLQNHPQIYMPAEKEPRFFVEELRPKPRDGKKPKRPATLDDYLSLFAGAGPNQRAGEASPQYLRYEEVPPAIAEVQPNARIIALLREPASFLRSFHGQMLHNRVETEKDFQKAMSLEDARRRGECLPRGCVRQSWLLYSDHVRYAEQLRRFHAVFPAEQVLVLIYEEYRNDNEAVVREVLRFLDVDDSLPVEQVDTRPLKDVRVQRLHHLTTSMQEARRNPGAVSPAVRALDALIPGSLREALGSGWRRLIYRPRAAPSEAFMLELRRRFKPEVEAVSEYLGRDLVALWGYDRLD